MAMWQEVVYVHCALGYTVKNAVELLDVPSKNNSLMMKKYNSHVELLFSYTHVLFFNSVIEWETSTLEQSKKSERTTE